MLKPANTHRQRGLSLIELMISITLGLIILVALLAVFSANNQSQQQTDATAQLQDNARAALDTLGRDISMAGYWGGMFGTANITPCDLGSISNTITTCGVGTITTTATAAAPALPPGDKDINNIPWPFLMARRIEFAHQPGSTPISAVFPYLSPNLQPNSDAVAIRRVAGQAAVDKAPAASTVTLVPYNFYMWSNGTSASVVRAQSSGTYPASSDPPLLNNTSFYKYVARVYYVRTYDHIQNGVKDNIPTLCRAELCGSGFSNPTTNIDDASCGAGPASASGFYAQCIAEGVEAMQIQWGLNLATPRTASTDCMVDTYSAQPTADQLSQSAVTARISVLMRTSLIDGSYVDKKTYVLSNSYTMTPDSTNNHYHRRIYSITVQLRNPNGDSGLCTH